jgi:hypothetical protein
MCVGLTFAAFTGLLLVACTRFRWWTDGVDYLLALLLTGGIAGVLVGFTRRISPLVAAQIADDRAGLQERLSTAVELLDRGSQSEIAQAQVADATRHAQQLRPAQVLPWRMPRQWRWLAAAAALLAAAIFLPDLPVFHSRQERLDRAAMREQGTKIRNAAKKVEERLAREKKNDQNSAILRRIAQNLKQLGKEMDQNRIPKKHAMLQANELQKQLQEAESKAGAGPGKKSMEQVASDLKAAAEKNQQQGNGEAAQSLQRMAENVRKRDFEGAKQQLQELAQKMRDGKMSAEEASKTADMLQEMARSMEGSSLERASNEMKDAASQLQKASQAAQKLQQQMASAKSDAERQQLARQAAQQLAQGAQQAADQAHKAGGT